MPVPKSNLYPDFNVVRLSHVELVVTDLGKSRAFYVDTLGLQITGENPSHIYLRAMEERGHHCLILTKGEKACARVLGFKVFSEVDLDKAKVWFEAQGRKTSWVTRPHQSRTLLTSDPHGIPLEFYTSMEKLPNIHQKYALYKGVKPLRIDHFNCFSESVDESVAFYNNMGFRVTEYTEDEASTSLVRTLAIQPEYLKTHGHDGIINYSEWTVPLGRRFRALKIWFLLRAYGLTGLRTMIRNNILWSQHLAKRLSAVADFRIVSAPMLSLFSFRHEPEGNEDLNMHNLKLINAINDDGRIYLTQTKVDGETVIRFQAGSFDMTEMDAATAFDVITEIATRITV